MLVALVLYHLSTDSLVPVSFDHHPKLPSIADGSDQPILNRPWVPAPGADATPCPLWTPLVLDEGTQMPSLSAGSRKILIYHEFAMMAPLILSVSGNGRADELASFNSLSSFFRYSRYMELMVRRSMVRKTYRSATRLSWPSRKIRSAGCSFYPMLEPLAST